MRLTLKKTAILVLAIVVAITTIFTIVQIPANAASSTKIGQATNGENGLKGNKPGDQKGKKYNSANCGEVAISSWCYSSKSGAYNNWRSVFRAKNKTYANKLADNMKKACANNFVGYDQGGKDRRTFDIQAEKANWKIQNIMTNCETTCSQSVATCIRCASLALRNDINTYFTTVNGDSIYCASNDLLKYLRNSEYFIEYRTKEYTAKTDNLQVGDILISPGHHSAMVVSGNDANNISNKFTLQVGRLYQLKVALNVRKGPGLNYAIKNRKKLTPDGKKHSYNKKKATLKKGTQVTCCTIKGKWIEIPSGWVCAKKGNLKYAD